MNRHERRKIAKTARGREAEVIGCAGRPICRRIVIGADGSEREYKLQPN